MKTFLAFLLAAATFVSAQEPEKKNALYGHPIQISSMVLFQTLPLEIGQTWLQADYERWLKEGLSAVGGVQYLNFFENDRSQNEGNFGFYDVLAGVRWYPNRTFSGFYLQPQLNYQRLFIEGEDMIETISGTVNRYGLSGALGFNGKWEHITVDWNVGICALASGEVKIVETNKWTDEVETIDLDDEENEFLAALMNPVFFTSGFAVGYMF